MRGMGNWERISGSKSKLCFIKLIGFTFRRTTRNAEKPGTGTRTICNNGNPAPPPWAIPEGGVYRQEKHTNEQRSFSTSPNKLIRAGCGGVGVGCVCMSHYVQFHSIFHFPNYSYSPLAGHARVEYEAGAFSIPHSFGFEFYSIFSSRFSICFAQ